MHDQFAAFHPLTGEGEDPLPNLVFGVRLRSPDRTPHGMVQRPGKFDSRRSAHAPQTTRPGPSCQQSRYDIIASLTSIALNDPCERVNLQAKSALEKLSKTEDHSEHSTLAVTFRVRTLVDT